MPRQVSIPTAKWRVCNDEVEPISQCIVIEVRLSWVSNRGHRYTSLPFIKNLYCAFRAILLVKECAGREHEEGIVTDTGLTPAEFSSIRETHKRW
ncbi:hypothetical protein J6590_055687 [Homalodisca vitripennis]|nr:hypothetical protein J6590_055687 [Homalodisca vitripennis]